MASISVDGRGLSFSLKIVAVLGVCAGLFSFLQTVHRSFAETEGVLGEMQASVTEGLDVVKVDEREGTYIDINFDTKSLMLVADSVEVGQYPLLNVPNGEGGTSVVPEGEYTVDEKVKQELSSVALVSFPYYVQFGDHYALHGVPEKVGASDGSENFVGNLVELAPSDAAEVYTFARAGMVVVVEPYHVTETSLNSDIKLSTESLPATSAQAYALKDLSTGKVYLVKDGGARYPIASITKLVTAAVATDVIGHGSEVMGPDGRYYTLSDLYYPLLLRSDNNVAQRFAVHAGFDYFISSMNTYVRALGMQESTFADASGLSPKNVSTANDLLVLIEHLYTNSAFILDITKEERVTITSRDGAEWSMENQNKLSSDPYFRGGKLGYTDEAGQTSLSVFNVPLGNEMHPIAVVVLQSKDWKQDTRTLLRWLVEGVK